MNPRSLGYVLAGITGAVIVSLFLFQQGVELKAQKWDAVSHDKTNFPLVGKHRTVSCSDCHLKGVFEGTPRDCEACHWYRKQDDRYRLQLGVHCSDCHTPVDWKILKPNSWDHGGVTGFPLSGVHKTMDCFSCHPKGVFKGQSGDCYSCHAEDYRRASNPNHSAGHFPLDCRFCHVSMLTWSGAKFDHSKFQLKGQHLASDCSACHQNGVYAGTPSQCVSCHLSDYNNTAEPNHKQAGFSTDCVTCHGNGAVTWKGAGFLHSKFVLKGTHIATACNNCHKNGVYAGTPSQCVSCHLTDYNNTADPNHKQAGFSTDCVTCHGDGALSWKGATFNHSKFILKGTHITTACTDCHKNGVYAGTPSQCVSCHLTDYNGTLNPNHKQSGFSTDCVTCHGDGAVSWKGAIFDHSKFVLNGVHKTTACTDCHKNGVYAGTPSQCVSCHLTDFNGTVEPNHQQAGFSTDCVPCHGTAALTWKGAVFNHTPYWLLQGPHVSLNCNKCHSAGYQLPTDCYGCHKANYDATTNPNHKTVGYPTACDNCHFPTHLTWTQAVFNHKFPIKSGKHAGFNCTDCHLTSNYLVFSCIDCHTHSKSETDSDHRDVRGYSYNSQACYSCHPTGNAD